MLTKVNKKSPAVIKMLDPKFWRQPIKFFFSSIKVSMCISWLVFCQGSLNITLGLVAL